MTAGTHPASRGVDTLPRLPDADLAARLGPYQVARYGEGISVPLFVDFEHPLIYYPMNKATASPAVVFVAGRGDLYMESPELLTQWGHLLASHGYIMLFLDTRDTGVLSEERAEILLGGIDLLDDENSRRGSPLAGKVDLKKIALMGHSFGAAGALVAVEEHDVPGVRAVIALNPVQELLTFAHVRVPVLIIHGTGDPYVSDTKAAYRNLTAGAPKALAVFAQTTDVQLGSMHLIGHSPLGKHRNDEQVAQLVTTFLHGYLAGRPMPDDQLSTSDGMDWFERKK